MSTQFDDGMIPPPPPPPQPPSQDDSTYAGQAGQSTYDPYAAQQANQQYDPNFAHTPYDPNQIAAQPYTDDNGTQGGWQPDFSQGTQQGAAGQVAQGGYDPVMGPPMGDDDIFGTPPGAPPPPAKPSKPANFQLGTKFQGPLKIKVPPHNLQFDEEYFLRLLAGSISLTKDEKARIIESIPKLRQSQVDELIRIFEEEKQKFAELGEEHIPQLEKLVAQHYEDWVDIEMKQEQHSKASDDEAQAEAIRKQLGI